MFELTVDPKKAPDKDEEVLIDWESGIPIAVNGERLSPAKVLHKLNEIGGRNGVGRVDMVESRFVGMKSRGVYETPGGTILHMAHRAMESITLDRDVINLKDSLMPRFARAVYNGFWYSPEMRLLLNFVKDSQRGVTGTTRQSLYKGNCIVTGRKSPYSLYDTAVVSMEADGGAFRQEDSWGFIRLHALPLKMAKRQNEKIDGKK
jgi:argininosuccinate synthase